LPVHRVETIGLLTEAGQYTHECSTEKGHPTMPYPNRLYVAQDSVPQPPESLLSRSLGTKPYPPEGFVPCPTDSVAQAVMGYSRYSGVLPPRAKAPGFPPLKGNNV
jgi:hypothetical protein